MSAIFSILSLTLLGLLTVSSGVEASSNLLATQAGSDVDGMSECIQGRMVDRKPKVLSKCSGFRGIVNNAQNRREFSYVFPAGTLLFYAELNPPGRFPNGVTMSDGRRSRSYYINRLFLNGREVDIQAILTSKRRSGFRCYVIDNYVEATCDLPDGTWVTYKQ